MSEIYYVVIDVGEYEYHESVYFAGSSPISKLKIEKKKAEIKKKLYNKFLKYPQRKIIEHGVVNIQTDVPMDDDGCETKPHDVVRVERYDPKTGKTVYEPGFGECYKELVKWLKSEGFTKLKKIIIKI
jgi:hypothetical protein